jgi:hypothetical protein
MFAKTVKVGPGDPNGGNPMVWGELVRTSGGLVQSEHKFTMEPEGSHSPRTFLWKRTSSGEVGDDAMKWSLQNFKLIGEETGETVATFANNGLKSWKKKGKFRLVEGVYGVDWEKWVLLTCLALIEKARRRNRASGAAGGAGGAH